MAVKLKGGARPIKRLGHPVKQRSAWILQELRIILVAVEVSSRASGANPGTLAMANISLSLVQSDHRTSLSPVPLQCENVLFKRPCATSCSLWSISNDIVWNGS